MKHLLSAADLSVDEALLVLDTAEEMARVAELDGVDAVTIEGEGAE